MKQLIITVNYDIAPESVEAIKRAAIAYTVDNLGPEHLDLAIADIEESLDEAVEILIGVALDGVCRAGVDIDSEVYDFVPEEVGRAR